MSKNTLFIFCALLILLSEAFSFFHYQRITSLQEAILLNIPAPHKMRDTSKQMTIPQEFVDFIKQGDGSAQGNLTAKEFSLKKLAFTVCLREVSAGTNFWNDEGSEELFKGSGATPLQANFIKQEAKKYASKHSIITPKKKKLWVSACLDYYDSSELKETLTRSADLP